ncbi:GMC family oxidoreductase [Alteromonadaceae bacterium M269]|nr:GMC family oxidoreductase [Alteromonadaceae bacterium M269]
MKSNNKFDAIVVGSGMSGGWAAKELTAKGLKTLVLERGKDTKPGIDYVGENKATWEMEFRDRVNPKLAKQEYAVQSQCYAFKESTRNFFANDNEQPYSTPNDKPFAWIRGDQVGGRSLLWARQSYRWSDLDFTANKRDGHGTDWPIRYEDVEKWYTHVEKFVGVSGSKEGLAQLPDSHFLPAIEMNCVEKHVKQRMEAKFSDRKMIIGRCAHLTKPTAEHLALGRANCQFRNQCQRGCSFGAYFSSVSATLPAARRTGNLTLVTDTIVQSIIYDEKTKKARGVRVVNRLTGDKQEYYARVVFLCASTFATLQIMLNSKSDIFKNGFANNSGTLGHYVMDHHHNSGARGRYTGFKDRYYYGRRPTGIYVPRFRNLKENNDLNFIRGYGFQGRASRSSWHGAASRPGFGEQFKNDIRTPGDWYFSLTGFGEMLPYRHNLVKLHPTKTDRWGIPQLHIDCSIFDNEVKMREDMANTATEILLSAGLVDVQPYNDEVIPGLGIHEMGGARMGLDPKTSVLNKYNQCHDVENVFVTDGAAMASSACQNPSLTYMALTARAVDYAVTQFNRGAI